MADTDPALAETPGERAAYEAGYRTVVEDYDRMVRKLGRDEYLAGLEGGVADAAHHLAAARGMAKAGRDLAAIRASAT